MERYCAYQERSHQEVLKKLKEMRMIAEASDLIMVHLIESDFLNEERFAKAFSKGKFNLKNWGRNRIRYELQKRDISKFNIKIALEELEEIVYQKKFNELAENKWILLSSEHSPPKRKRKLADYLLYRGWESEMVYDKIAKLSSD